MSKLSDIIEAHTAICLLEAATKILEGSDIRGHRTQNAALRAIRILRQEQQSLLRDYDKARASLPAHSGNTP